MWDIIRSLVVGGTTLLPTTQYLDEADELAREIVVIDDGLVIAAGTAEQLKDRVGGDALEFTVPDRARCSDAVTAISKIGQSEPHVDVETGVISIGSGAVGPMRSSRRCAAWTTPPLRPAAWRCDGPRSTMCSSP
jgi:ABC-2 type transport system ATP-binding protein